MSLISEALKKARLESARKEDRRHGVLAPSHVRQRRSIWPWIVTAISLSLTVGVIVGVVLRGGADEPAPQAVVAPIPQNIPVETAQPAVETAEAAPPQQASPVARVVEVTPEPEPAPAANVPVIQPEQVAPLVPSASEVEAPAPASSRELDSPMRDIDPGTLPSPGPKDGESFLRTVPLPGGEELVLNGIAWASSGPVALINGRAVEKGEYVGGWKVELIERREVELVREGVTIRVRLK